MQHEDFPGGQPS